MSAQEYHSLSNYIVSALIEYSLEGKATYFLYWTINSLLLWRKNSG